LNAKSSNGKLRILKRSFIFRYFILDIRDEQPELYLFIAITIIIRIKAIKNSMNSSKFVLVKDVSKLYVINLGDENVNG